MNIKIYKHSSLKTQIDDDIGKISMYFSSDFVKQYINEPITYDVENTSKDYMDASLFKPLEGKYDTALFIYEKGTFSIYGQTRRYSNTLNICYCSVNPVEDKIDYSWKVFVHELLHSLCFQKNVPNVLDTYYKNDEPFASDGNFAKQLALLKPLYQRWKYFKLTEFTNYEKTHTIAELNTGLVDLLDKMRGECGFAFKITSGFRTKVENDNIIDAVGDSAHLKGLAVDIQCLDDAKRYKMLEVAIKNGIKRIGQAKTYLHFDIDETKSQYVEWLYN